VFVVVVENQETAPFFHLYEFGPWSRRKISCRKLFSPQISGRSIEYVSKGIKKLLSFECFQGTNASHLWKRTIIFPTTLGRDMLVSRRISNESHVFSFLQVATDKIQLLCLESGYVNCVSCFKSAKGLALTEDTLQSQASFVSEEASQRKSKMEQLNQKLNQTKEKLGLER